MPTLSDNTVVAHPDTGAPTALLKGQEIPEWALAREGDEPALVGDHLIVGTAPTIAPNPPVDIDALPPTSGKGSGVEAWAKYADDHGIAYPDGAGRDEIIATVEAHKAEQ